ncbi:DUF6950 family protein [Rhizobium sp. YIM 134829]|uniref:DUF6950 family protein n=1 Tax=Rhizobium sp. YIM 134829 TaxID=3390453 RepID=UPI0039796D27
MTADLGAFIRAMAASEFRWGEKDCALVIADWWAANHGGDPAAHLRGAYSSDEDCQALLREVGGLARLVRRIAVAAGAARSAGDRPGDFAVIRYGNRHLGAIRSASGRWVVKSQDGVIAIKNAKVVAAWSV